MSGPATLPIPIQSGARVCADQPCALTCPIASAGRDCPTLAEYFGG
jgi:hypothetical protein